jgi:nitronate monooxygenase
MAVASWTPRVRDGAEHRDRSPGGFRIANLQWKSQHAGVEEERMNRLRELLGIELPVIQAPMAGVQGSPLAIAVSNAGGLGSLPCAMLTIDGLRKELGTLRASTGKPFNVNFFAHRSPVPNEAAAHAWRDRLGPYHRELGLDPGSIPADPVRIPFDAAAAEVLDEFQPAIVSFHFGLPAPALLARI